MKTLSIQQPWASLIVAGLKDVENRTWKTDYRGRILIHASTKKVPKGFLYAGLPVEIIEAVKNFIYMGGMEDFDDVPLGAIIGYVDLKDIKDDTYEDSIWAQGAPCQWLVDNAYIFDEPIMGIKGKLNLWEYDLDENNLPPAHKACTPEPVAVADELVLPISQDVYDMYVEEQFFHIYATPSIQTVVCEEKADENGMSLIKKFKTLLLKVAGGEQHRYTLPEGVLFYQETDGNGELVTYFSLFNSEDQPLCYVGGPLGEEV